MPAVDTNVLVRWLAGDDELQLRRSQALFESARRTDSRLLVAITVALELEWVLRSRYGYDKQTMLRAFDALLETWELEFQNEAAIEHALHMYRGNAAEFADCMHAALCAAVHRAPVLTFDAKAARLPGVELL